MNGCSSHSNHMGACTCGFYHASTNSFSMLFSSPNPHDQNDPYAITSSPSSSSSVDCTLSLGTPSTRQTNHDMKSTNHKSASFMSNICGWGAFQTKQSTPKSNKGSTSNGVGVINTLNGDPLVPRRCANCDTTSTPLWRNGPKGPKSLCNACGIRYKKEERRATNPTGVTAAAAPTIIESQHLMPHHSWGHHHHQSSEFRFIDDEENNVPFLSWRLSVQDRPSLVHDYTY